MEGGTGGPGGAGTTPAGSQGLEPSSFNNGCDSGGGSGGVGWIRVNGTNLSGLQGTFSPAATTGFSNTGPLKNLASP